eukprot:Skav231698  [mRNA]  locus=scaffold597:1259241:1260086:- [translate_table: standard]
MVLTSWVDIILSQSACPKTSTRHVVNPLLALVAGGHPDKIQRLVAALQEFGLKQIQTGSASFGPPPAMSCRRLEWVGDFDMEWDVDHTPSADDWTLFEPDDCCYENMEEDDGEPGWFVMSLQIMHEHHGDLTCSFLRRLDGGVAAYEAEKYVEEWGGEYIPTGIVYVREVPRDLVFTCTFTIVNDVECQAVITNLAGSEVLNAQLPLLPVLMSDPLLKQLRDTVRAKGLLRSKNQRVRLLWADHASEIRPQQLLWRKAPPGGFLQASVGKVNRSKVRQAPY